MNHLGLLMAEPFLPAAEMTRTVVYYNRYHTYYWGGPLYCNALQATNLISFPVYFGGFFFQI